MRHHHPQLKLTGQARALALAFAPLAWFSGAAMAQSTPTERIEITGSSIKRIDAETALPVQVLNRTDIERTGVSTAEQLLKAITVSSTLGATSVANTGPGGGQGGGGSVSLVSLRGLGSARTLVLVNGRRSAPVGSSSAVDIGTIPVAAIERVEVLQDGASAVYGSDAIAGVVNFILRKDYQGTEVSATLGSPTRNGGGTEGKFSVFTGFGDFDSKGFSATASASYQQIKPIYGSSRPELSYLNVPNYLDKTNAVAFPANVLLPNGSLANPAYPNCGPYSLVSPLQPGICRYDYVPYIAIQPETKSGNLALNARLNISSAVEGYFESSYTHNVTDNQVQHLTISPAAVPAGNPYIASLTNFLAGYPTLTNLKKYIGQTATFLPPTSPYYPTAFAAANGVAGQPLLLYFRSVPTGVRKTEDVTDNVRLVTGLRGTVAGWDYDAGALYGESTIKDSLTGGWALIDKYLNLVNSGVINPFGPTTDPAAQQAALDSNYNGLWYTNKAKIAGVDAKASRELMKIAGGSVGLALGAEFRRESIDLLPSAANQQDLVLGFGGLGGVPVAAKRNVSSVYTEVNVPVLKTLELNAAVRYDNYQNVGNTTNPKGSFRWHPVEEVLFRGSWGSGFRAPTLNEAYAPQSIGGVTTNGQVDSQNCPDPKAAGAASNPDCSAQYNLLVGGNPNLKPERSESKSFGFLFEPSKTFSVGADFYSLIVKDTIVAGPASYQTILANEGKFANLIFRGADGRISAINQGNTNLGKTITRGVDLQVKARVLDQGGNRVTAAFNGTYVTKYDRQNLDGSYTSSINNPGAAGAIGVIMRWRHRASTTWDTGNWSSTLAWNYQNPYHDTRTPLQPASVPTRDVVAYYTLDAQVAYTGFKSIKLAVGAKNLTNVAPPYTNYGGGFVGSYDISYADVRGRFLYGTATYSFK